MRYRTQSANVLNEADRFQAILDWQLFSHEQDVLLNGYIEGVEWKPGDPIHLDPRKVIGGDGCLCPDCNEGRVEGPENYEGNTVRPMISEYEDGNGAIDALCPRCDVWWALKPDNASCFICEKDFSFLIPERPKPVGIWRHNPEPWVDSIFFDPIENMRAYVASELNREMGDNWRSIMQAVLDRRYRVADVETTMRGITVNYVITDEAFLRPYAAADVEMTRHLWRNANPPVVFHPPTQLSPFERAETEPFELEVIPDFYVDDTWLERAPWRPGIARLLREAGPAIFEKPALEVPTFETPKYLYQGNYARNTINTPITEQRRRRNL